MRESSSTRQYLPSHSTQSPPLHPIHTHNHTPTPSQYLTSPPTTSLPYTHPHVPTFPLTHLCTSPLTLTSPTLKMTSPTLIPVPTYPHNPPYLPSFTHSHHTSVPTHPFHNTLIPPPPSQAHPYTSPPSHMHHTSAPPTLTITTTPLHHPHPHTSAPHTFILTVCFQASSETSWSWWSRVFPSAACVRGRGRGEGWRERT